jgi:hypothetical protein
MIPLASLPLVAALLLTIAVAVAWWRRRDPSTAIRQAWTALLVALTGVVLAALAYGLGRSPEMKVWRNLGGLVLLATPAATAAVLRVRHRLPWIRGAIVGFVFAAGVLIWLLFGLRGPGGAWSALRVILVSFSTAVLLASAVCGAAWTRRTLAALVAGLAVLGAGCSNGSEMEQGVLVIEVRDGDTGQPIPARLAIVDGEGKGWIAEDALPIAGDCGILPLHNWLPAVARWQVRAERGRSLWNPFRETEEFYIDGSVSASLPAGQYTVRATHGPEYSVATRKVPVEAEVRRTLALNPARWIDLPSEGWYSADDHLHIPRPDASFDPLIATWIAAEDLHVANLLQMGLARDVHITPQHRFGVPGAHHHGTTLLLSGQENPRTHIFGHSIILGAPNWIDFPSEYLLYPRFWRRAHENGAMNGLAHFGVAGAGKSLALWAHSGLLDFLEVENFGFPFYERWYEVLNLGLRLTPTAGTDYPCVPNLPGRDRFYAHVEGPFTIEGWADAVRAGRTFVTNGPALDLFVGGLVPGSELHAKPGDTVHIRARVRFDPERDRVTRLELVEKGAVVHAVERNGPGGEIVFEFDHPLAQTTWLAARAYGVKPGEVRPPGLELLQGALDYPPPRPGRRNEPLPVPAAYGPPVSAAHTAPVWITIGGTPPLFAQAAACPAARAWLSRLADVEYWLSEDAPSEVTAFPGRGDGVPAADLQAHRRALLSDLAGSRAWLTRAGAGTCDGEALRQPR